MILADPKTHDEWLSARCAGIGGSDAACVLGMNKYKTNVQLWKEKTGITVPKDISDKPAVAYGKQAEFHLRELFALDFPQYDIEYHEYRMYANDKYPFIFATLDGELLLNQAKREFSKSRPQQFKILLNGTNGTVEFRKIITYRYCIRCLLQAGILQY